MLNPIAVNKNVQTATNDLILNLGRPHKPWPLVQPLDNFVPKPTRSPAKKNPGNVVQVVISFSGPKGWNPLLLLYPKRRKKMAEIKNIPPTMLNF